MALPVAPPPKPNDVAALGWAGLTIRIAWTLLVHGVKVRPDVLRDCRTHALFHLEASANPAQAEDLAGQLTEEFIRRARGDGRTDPWPQDRGMPLSPRWRTAVLRSLDPLGEAVFRKHYGDNRGLERLEHTLGVDASALEAARAGIREVVRRSAIADGMPIRDWTGDRLDRLLSRLAAWSPGPCPPVLDIVEGCHRDHVAGCARCERLFRLVSADVIAVDDLFAPSVGARPSDSARVLALQVHPDARRHRAALIAELPVPAFPVSADVVLVDGDALAVVGPVLALAAEVGAPAAAHLRGALLCGPGRWSSRGLLGPLAAGSTEALEARPWGEVEGVGALPAALPPPPSARGPWAAVGVLALVGLVLLRLLWSPPATAGPHANLEVAFTAGRGGHWVVFDVPEPTLVTLVAERDGALQVVLVSEAAADKAAVAAGDGSYRVHVPGQAALLLAHDAPLRSLGAALHDAAGASDPIAALAKAVQAEAIGRWQRR